MKVTYVLKDGTKLDTMEGYVIPYREDTARLYQKVAQVLMTPKEKTA